MSETKALGNYKTCNGCKASKRRYRAGFTTFGSDYCNLGFIVENVPIRMKDGTVTIVLAGHPAEPCPKPMTWKQLDESEEKCKP